MNDGPPERVTAAPPNRETLAPRASAEAPARRALPIKPRYGPTLGTLLSPRWRAASPFARRAAVAGAVVVTALAAALVLTLLNARYSHGGPVPFSFSYRNLYRTAPDPGGYVKVRRVRPDGTLAYSFAVAPLTLPPYRGELEAELPLVADGYIHTLERRDRDFALSGEGKTKVNGVSSAYQVVYTTIVDGRRMLGRDIMLLPERAGARRGVVIAMIATKGKGLQASSPLEVGGTGVLALPFRSFSVG